MSPSRKRAPAGAAGAKGPVKRGAASAPAGAAKKGAGDTADAMSFEDALERLEEIVARLEAGEIPLEESIQAYAEGTRLVKQCVARLEAAEATIRDLSEKGGAFTLEPSVLAGDDDDESDDEAEDDEDEEEDEDGELPF